MEKAGSTLLKEWKTSEIYSLIGPFFYFILWQLIIRITQIKSKSNDPNFKKSSQQICKETGFECVNPLNFP